MKLGIVGNAKDKFTALTEKGAKNAIINLLWDPVGVTQFSSGGCHLGGIDAWAEEAATELEIPKKIFPSTTKTWSGAGGYRARNLKIVKASDRVACIVVEDYPPGYRDMKYGVVGSGEPYCYHCEGRIPKHVKSGGCWTAWRAKEAVWIIVRADGSWYQVGPIA